MDQRLLVDVKENKFGTADRCLMSGLALLSGKSL